MDVYIFFHKKSYELHLNERGTFLPAKLSISSPCYNKGSCKDSKTCDVMQEKPEPSFDVLATLHDHCNYVHGLGYKTFFPTSDTGQK